MAFGDTGNIVETSSPNWEQFALVFQTLAGQNEIILKMINNGQGGCGNDLAIDDIEFKSCGDTVIVTDFNDDTSVSLCSSQTPFNSTLTATPDFVVYRTHFYQWQESTDSGATWNDIAGQMNQTLSISPSNTTYYRAKIAEVAINLSNPQCVSFSDEYQLTINQLPPMPTIACWETAIINNSTCSWEITGTQPIQPTIECWETASFNTTTCSWDVFGTQSGMPTGLNCWETATFNNSTCVWDVSGTQPVQPTIECWETVSFNTVTCSWDVFGTQPVMPTGLNCWESASFNNSTCVWDVSGTQPVQPTIECWKTVSFNTVTCSWDIFGIQPAMPTGLSCWETATFNNSTCVWDVSGTRPVQPTTSCYETATFNTGTCSWDITGTQPPQPNLLCWEIATFNNATCSWSVSGTQPIQPVLECWETATFNTVTCSWEVSGTQPGNVIEENLELCEGTSLTLQAQTNISNPSYVWSTGSSTDEIIINTAGTFSVEITNGFCSFETIIFNIILLETPIIENVISDGNNIVVTTLNTGDFLYSINGNIFQPNNIFYNVEGGFYSIYVKQSDCNNIITSQHLHFYIPKFFTPNGDGVKDTFSLAGIEYFSSSQVSIFNRYGKLLKSSTNSPFEWDGKFQNEYLPTDDYWYLIIIEGQKFMGHFTLKR